jgi:anti-sigma B factor antagonist
MTTTIKEENNNQVVYFDGRLDTAVSMQVQKDVQPLIDNIKSDVILDCEKLLYISSSGLRIFLGILKSAKPTGHHVYIRHLSNEIRQVFTITGFINLFEFKD